MTQGFDPSNLTAGAAKVLREIVLLAATGEPFSSDAVRARLDAQGVTVNPDDVGNGFLHARKVARLIERVGETHSRRPEAHGRRILVYRLVGAKDTPQDAPQDAQQTVLAVE